MNYDGQVVVYSHDGIKLSAGSKCGSVTGVHAHDDEYQFEVLLSGKSRSIIKNQQDIVLPGFIEVYNPADLHEIDYQNTESIIFHLQIDVVKKIHREIETCSQEPIFNTSIKNRLNIPLPFLYQEMVILKNISELTHTNTTIDDYQENKVLTLLRLLLEQSSHTHKYLPAAERASFNKVKKAPSPSNTEEKQRL